MIQLILHLIGDYVTQSDWMAQRKTKETFAAACHALVYSLPFLAIGSVYAWSVILWTHFFIDRFRLARFVCYLKNQILSPAIFGQRRWENYKGMEVVDDDPSKKFELWKDCDKTGYRNDSPPWLTVWLMIAADNTLHLAINFCSLKWL